MRGLEKIIIVLLLGLVFQTSAYAYCYPYEKARTAGFTDSQIVDYLINEYKQPIKLYEEDGQFEFQKARDAGAPDRQIVDFLSKKIAGTSCESKDIGKISAFTYPQPPPVPTASTSERNSSDLLNIDVPKALEDAATQTVLKLVGGFLVFMALSFGILNKPKDTKLKMGRWVAAWVAAAAMSSIKISTVNEIAASIAQVVSLGLMGFLIGCAWRAIRPVAPTSPRSVPEAKISDVFYERALAEYSTDQRDSGMWARLFATHDGDENKVKAAYIKERAEVLSRQAL